MTKAMRRRPPIVVEEGKRRPHEPVQSAKFASAGGIIIRESMPVLRHWKDYKKDENCYRKFEGELSVNAISNLSFYTASPEFSN
jgi:hypothetical protein